jgi:hypothetical protein
MSQSRFVRERNLADISFDDFVAAKLQQAFNKFAVTPLPTQIPKHSATKGLPSLKSHFQKKIFCF